MARTIVAVYDEVEQARETVNDLVDRGFDRSNISMIARDPEERYARELETTRETTGPDVAEGAGVGAATGAVVGGLGGVLVGLGALAIPGIGPVIAAGPIIAGLVGAGAGALVGGVIGALVDAGLPEQDAQMYAEGVRRGGTLVMLQTSDEREREAMDVMRRHEPVDIDRRAQEWRQEGWTRFDPQAGPYRATTMQGGVIRQYDMDAGRMGAGAAPGTGWTTPRDYSDYDTTFRRHYQMNYADQGYPYERYEPAYHYGYNLASNPNYRGRSWMEVEPEARRRWEERNPGTWDYYRNVVQDAWNEVTGRAA